MAFHWGSCEGTFCQAWPRSGHFHIDFYRKTHSSGFSSNLRPACHPGNTTKQWLFPLKPPCLQNWCWASFSFTNMHALWLDRKEGVVTLEMPDLWTEYWVCCLSCILPGAISCPLGLEVELPVLTTAWVDGVFTLGKCVTGGGLRES